MSCPSASTIAVVQAALAVDGTLDIGARRLYLRALRLSPDALAGLLARAGRQPTLTAVEPSHSDSPMVLRRSEAARLLSVSARTVDSLVSTGQLRRVRLPGRRRGCGVAAETVRALVQGVA